MLSPASLSTMAEDVTGEGAFVTGDLLPWHNPAPALLRSVVWRIRARYVEVIGVKHPFHAVHPGFRPLLDRRVHAAREDVGLLPHDIGIAYTHAHGPLT